MNIHKFIFKLDLLIRKCQKTGAQFDFSRLREFVLNEKGISLDEIVLCPNQECVDGKTLDPDGESAVVPCPKCNGRGFLKKG